MVLGGRAFVGAWGQPIATAVQATVQQVFVALNALSALTVVCAVELQATDQREIRAVAQLFDAMVRTTLFGSVC